MDTYKKYFHLVKQSAKPLGFLLLTWWRHKQGGIIDNKIAHFPRWMRLEHISIRYYIRKRIRIRTHTSGTSEFYLMWHLSSNCDSKFIHSDIHSNVLPFMNPRIQWTACGLRLSKLSGIQIVRTLFLSRQCRGARPGDIRDGVAVLLGKTMWWMEAVMCMGSRVTEWGNAWVKGWPNQFVVESFAEDKAMP